MWSRKKTLIQVDHGRKTPRPRTMKIRRNSYEYFCIVRGLQRIQRHLLNPVWQGCKHHSARSRVKQSLNWTIHWSTLGFYKNTLGSRNFYYPDYMTLSRIQNILQWNSTKRVNRLKLQFKVWKKKEKQKFLPSAWTPFEIRSSKTGDHRDVMYARVLRKWSLARFLMNLWLVVIMLLVICCQNATSMHLVKNTRSSRSSPYSLTSLVNTMQRNSDLGSTMTIYSPYGRLIDPYQYQLRQSQ